MKIYETTQLSTLQFLNERKIDLHKIVEKMAPIVQEVKVDGDAAIKRLTKIYDKKELSQIAVEAARINEAEKIVSQRLKSALQKAKANITAFHAAQMPREWMVEVQPGIQVGQLVRPIDRIGCYIPGGRYPLVSTVLMTLIPAIVAGVRDIIVCTPNTCPEILYACQLCGVERIFEVGGGMAISAMAYGTENIPKVDKIVGPGNVYVTAAKKIVYGDVGIDFLAGPSEVVVIADEEADPRCIAADMLAQAEHDVTSMSLCITPSKNLGLKVIEVVDNMLKALPTRETAREALDTRGGVLVVKSLEEAFSISNAIAPEHIEIHLKQPSTWLPLIKNTASVFLGRYSPEAAGDYASGSNHVLPTGGFARAQSGLGVKDFILTPTVQELTEEGLKAIAPAVIALADAEGLAAHAASIKVRCAC